MAKLITVFWRDIPAQVMAKRGRTTAKVHLSKRFQVAIDRAAMRAGKGSSDAYLSEWRREFAVCSDDLDEEARIAAERIESEFTDQDLDTLAKSKGVRVSAE